MGVRVVVGLGGVVDRVGGWGVIWGGVWIVGGRLGGWGVGREEVWE